MTKGPSTELHLRLDARVYSREAVLRACYWMSDRCEAEVQALSDPTAFEVVLRSEQEGAIDQLRADFNARVIDESLRESVSKQTAEIRELIMAKAFSAPGLLDDPVPGDDRDPVEQDSD